MAGVNRREFLARCSGAVAVVALPALCPAVAAAGTGAAENPRVIAGGVFPGRGVPALIEQYAAVCRGSRAV